MSIVELGVVEQMVSLRQSVASCGGGGIPATRREGNQIQGAVAAIDKDFAASILARQL